MHESQKETENEFVAHSELADVADETQVIPEAVRSRTVRAPYTHSVYSIATRVTYCTAIN